MNILLIILIVQMTPAGMLKTKHSMEFKSFEECKRAAVNWYAANPDTPTRQVVGLVCRESGSV